MSVIRQIQKSRLIHLCVALTFFTSGLIINFAQLLLHVLVKPINPTLCRRLMRLVCYSLYSELIFLADWWSNSKLRIYMDDELKKKAGSENVLLIMNHTYEIDWLTGWMFTEKVGVLGNCKAYAKKPIAYVPVIGWAWKLADFVFLERSFEKDRETIGRQLKSTYAYPDPVWLLLSAEGTRFTPSKHEASVKFAKERGLPVLKHHLVPRSKGFTTSLPTLRSLPNPPFIYDINLAFKKDAATAPTMMNIMNGEPVEGYMYVRRIPLDSIPQEEEKAAEWLQQLFREKDQIIDSFHNTGSFFKESGFKETPYTYYNRSLSSLLNFVFWAFITLSLILYYLITSLLTQNWIFFTILVGILVGSYVLMGKAIDASKISKGSKYGADTKSSKSQ